MAAKLPEVVITSTVLRIRMSFGKKRVYNYVGNSHGRQYLLSKIQNSSQLTGSSNISETMTYIIKTPVLSVILSEIYVLPVWMAIFAIFGYPSMSHLYVDNFFEFGVVENFVYRTRIAVIITSDLFGCI